MRYTSKVKVTLPCGISYELAKTTGLAKVEAPTMKAAIMALAVARVEKARAFHRHANMMRQRGFRWDKSKREFYRCPELIRKLKANGQFHDPKKKPNPKAPEIDYGGLRGRKVLSDKETGSLKDRLKQKPPFPKTWERSR